jgi:hypothetical protein
MTQGGEILDCQTGVQQAEPWGVPLPQGLEMLAVTIGAATLQGLEHRPLAGL